KLDYLGKLERVRPAMAAIRLQLWHGPGLPKPARNGVAGLASAGRKSHAAIRRFQRAARGERARPLGAISERSQNFVRRSDRDRGRRRQMAGKHYRRSL